MTTDDRGSRRRLIGKAASLLGGAVAALALLILVIAAWMVSRRQVPSVLGYSLLHIVSGSMEPEIPTDTYIVVKKTPAEKLREGDVISFYSSDPAIYMLPNTHRIHQILQREDGIVFITKGDANNTPDEAEVTADRLIGRVVGQAGFLRTVGRWMRTPWVFILVVVVPLSAIIVWEMIDIAKIRAGKKKEKPDDEEGD